MKALIILAFLFLGIAAALRGELREQRRLAKMASDFRSRCHERA